MLEVLGYFQQGRKVHGVVWGKGAWMQDRGAWVMKIKGGQERNVCRGPRAQGGVQGRGVQGRMACNEFLRCTLIQNT